MLIQHEGLGFDFKKMFTIPKAVRKSRVIGPVLATAAAVALIPGVAPTIRKGAKYAGTGLYSIAKEIAKGGKYIGKTAKEAILKTAKGKIVRFLLPQKDIQNVNKLKRTEITPAIASGVDLREIQAALKEGLFPSEVIQEGAKTGLSPELSFSPQQIKKTKEGKITRALPIVAGVASLGVTLLRLKR